MSKDLMHFSNLHELLTYLYWMQDQIPPTEENLYWENYCNVENQLKEEAR